MGRQTTVLALTVLCAGVTAEARAAACDRVTALGLAHTTVTSADSDIKIEVWLPLNGWNGKFLAVGNGAWQGSIPYPTMAEGLRRGYATSATDTGHVGGSASFGMGHPEKVTDCAYRAVHEMTVTAKAIVSAFYSRAPQRAYWNGCSAQAVRIAQALQKPKARLTPAALQVLHQAVVTACDAMDGATDGLLENPVACTFDPRSVACSGEATSDCLGLARGSKLGWTELGWSASARATGLDHFRYLVFADPQWDVQEFDVTTDLARLSDGVIAALDARDSNLKPFFDRGGKLLHYHGWSDPQITPLASRAYHDRVAAQHGGVAAISGHTEVEQGQAPERIVASHRTNGKIDRTRPPCPYPQVARYTGTGTIDEAANFVCQSAAAR